MLWPGTAITGDFLARALAIALACQLCHHPFDRLVPRTDDRLGFGQRPLRDLLAIDRQRAGAAALEGLASRFHLPIEGDGMLAGRQCIGALPLGTLDVEQVVSEGGLAVLEIQSPTREPAAP
jgi:hypothetical protein